MTNEETVAKNFSKYTDKELLEILGQKSIDSDAAFTEIYNRYSDSVYRFCYFFLNDGDAANDIFQETFVNYLAKCTNVPDVVNIKSYLLHTAKNLCLNHKRNKKIEVGEVLEDTLIIDFDELENKELNEIVMKALDLIDEKYKHAFILREIDGLSYKEIGDMLEISWSGAQSRVVRAKEKLITLLEPYLKEYKT